MGYIYCIENKVNNKKYVGKTIHTIEQRGAEHKRDVSRLRRPLYLAIQKYGIDNFIIKELEQCSDDIIEERERYGIKELGTFHNGYNMTLGGDGTEYFDHTDQEVIEIFNKLGEVNKTAEYFNCDVDTISVRLHRNNIDPRIIHSKKMGKRIRLTDPENIVASMEFDTQGEAAQGLIEHGYAGGTRDTVSINIGRCTRGLRKTCCGFQGEKIE